jgi:hypothetical protein
VLKAFYILIFALLIQYPGLSQDPLPAVIEKDTLLTEEGSPYFIKQNISINNGITLKISEGTQIIISGGVTVSNRGRLVIQGSETKQVLFTSESPETRWNYISNEGSLYASHLMIRRAVRFVSSSGDTLIVEHCDVSDTYGGAGDDCIAAHNAKKVIISNTSLTGNPESGKTDAIDLDGVSGGTVSGNIISDFSDDGIDIGTGSSNMVVGENVIRFCDMGISVGEGSSVLAYRNLVSHSNAGIQSHTGANVDAKLNTLYGNNYGIRAFHYDGDESSGGTIYVSSSIISGSVLGDVIGVSTSTALFEYTLTDLVLLAGTGNITGSPLFLDVANGDFRLSSNSDAIDAGNPDLDGDGLDYLVDGDDRDPDGTRLDMGCYPFFHSDLNLVEISPSNLSLQIDPLGKYSDWFKIYNRSASSVNLKGHYISDKQDSPFKYRIQEDLIVPAGDTLTLWADDMDDLENGQVPFKLSGAGEALLLSNPSGILMEEKVFPRVPINYVYIKNESNGNWVYSSWPTGEGAVTYDSLCNDPEFSNPGGAQALPVSAFLTSPDADDSIYYTMDGGDPKQGQLFQTSFEADQPATVRAVILKEGHLPGYSKAAAYFSQDAYHLPVLSLSTDEENLYGPTGIYTNYGSEGPLWERPASFSYYSDLKQFSAINGIRIQGGNSVFMPKKAFRLHFRGGYGASVLDASPFDKGPSSFRNLVLRSGYDDDITTSTGTLLRDPFSNELWEKLGELATESDFGVLLLNNNYWGIYNIRESINEYFIHDNMGIREFDLVRFQKWGADLKYGTMDEWNKLVAYFDSTDFTRPEAYDEVSGFMDMNSLLNLLALVHCTQFRSWTWGAFVVKPTGGQWQWTIWDTDRSYNTLSWNGFTEYAFTSAEKWPNFIPQKLITNLKFRNSLINRNCDLLNSLFVPDRVIGIYDSLVSVLEPEMDAEYERWKPGNRERWDQNNEQIREFLRQRPSYLYDQMKAYFGIDDTVRITLRIEGNGRVKLNSLVIDQELWDGTYMSGVPIELEAWPAEGARFIEWRDLSTQHHIELDPAASREIVAVFDTTLSEPRESLVINEIMYHPETSGQSEWVEIYNPNPRSVSLQGFEMTDGGSGNVFLFGEGTIIDSCGFLVVAGNAELFLSEYGSTVNLAGSFNEGISGFKLGNEGEALLLKNSEGEPEDYVRYDDQAPWPVDADGNGPSLQLIAPDMDNSQYSSWYASMEPKYTPGSFNKGYSTEETPANKEDTLRVYPNPLGEVLFIDLDEEAGTRIQVQIYTLTGSLERNMEFLAGGGFETKVWNHGLTRPGAYIVQIMVRGQKQWEITSRLLIFSGGRE